MTSLAATLSVGPQSPSLRSGSGQSVTAIEPDLDNRSAVAFVQGKFNSGLPLDSMTQKIIRDHPECGKFWAQVVSECSRRLEPIDRKESYNPAVREAQNALAIGESVLRDQLDQMDREQARLAAANERASGLWYKLVGVPKPLKAGIESQSNDIKKLKEAIEDRKKKILPGREEAVFEKIVKTEEFVQSWRQLREAEQLILSYRVRLENDEMARDLRGVLAGHSRIANTSKVALMPLPSSAEALTAPGSYQLTSCDRSLYRSLLASAPISCKIGRFANDDLGLKPAHLTIQTAVGAQKIVATPMPIGLVVSGGKIRLASEGSQSSEVRVSSESGAGTLSAKIARAVDAHASFSIEKPKIVGAYFICKVGTTPSPEEIAALKKMSKLGLPIFLVEDGKIFSSNYMTPASSFPVKQSLLSPEEILKLPEIAISAVTRAQMELDLRQAN